jgi:hypothetical protein
MHAIADDHQSPGFIGATKEGPNVFGAMLAIAVKVQRPREASGTRPLPARAQRRTLADVARETNDLGASLCCGVGGAVRRVGVDHNHHFEVLPHARHDFADARGFIEAGNDSGALA